MRILITGAAGFVGSSLIRTLLAANADFEIIGIDDLSFGYKERLKDLLDKFTFIEADVNKISDLAIPKIDKIIHAAAIAPLPECQISYRRTIEQNVLQCASIIDYAIQAGNPDIIFFSSGAVYENAKVLPSVEADFVETHLAYTTSKFMAERLFNSYSRSYAASVTCVRLFNLYGEEQDYFRKQPPLIGYLLKSILSSQKITLYNKSSARRDYIHISDLTDLIIKMLQAKNKTFEIVNACTGNALSVLDVVHTIEKVSHKKFEIAYSPPGNLWDRYIDSPNISTLSSNVISTEVHKEAIGSFDKAATLYGWKPVVSFEEGITACLQYAQTKIG